MTPLLSRSAWVVPFALLALVGAGCAPAEPASPTTPGEPSKPSPSAPAATSTTVTPPSTGDYPQGLPTIDATWRTYTSRAGTFSFQYPLRGQYAPTWGVTYLKSTDAELDNGCYRGVGNPRQNQGTLIVGDHTFCVTRYEDPGAGQRYWTDYYATTVGSETVLIAFSVRLANGDNFEDEACHGKTVRAVGSSCQPFDDGYYKAHLDQIVGTFTEVK